MQPMENTDRVPVTSNQAAGVIVLVALAFLALVRSRAGFGGLINKLGN